MNGKKKNSRSKCLTVCHVNVRSLSAPTRLVDLEILCANNNVDILCLSETWLSPSHSSSTLKLNGFQPLFRRDRPCGSHGGVGIYVRNSLSVTPLPLPPAINIECLCLCIHLTRRTKMNVIVGYRAPSSPPEPFFTQLDEVVSHVQGHSNTPLCVLGDFNAKHSDWLPSQPTTAAGKHAMDFCITNNLVQTVTEPTYGLHTSHPSTLDLILLNKPHLLDHWFVLPPVADHCPTLANLRLTGQRHCQPVSYSTWNYENMDSTGLHDALSSIDWSPVLNCECVDTATERWSSLFLSTVSDYVPKVLHTSRSKGKPWYSAFLHRFGRVRDRLFQRWKRQPNNSSHRESYCRVRNWYVSELRLAEQQFYRSISDSLRASRSSSHRWWKKIKSVCGFSSLDQIPPLSSGTTIHVSPLEKAEVLNTAFARQCSAPTKTNSPLITPITPAEEFQFTPIDPETVYVALRKLNRWKASGVDGITNHLLKLCAKHIDVPLAHVFNLSLRSGSPCHVEASPCAACLQAEGWPKFSRKLSPYCTSVLSVEGIWNLGQGPSPVVLSRKQSFTWLPVWLPSRSLNCLAAAVCSGWLACSKGKGHLSPCRLFGPGKSLWSRWPPDSNKKTGFFWSKLNLCWLVQSYLTGRTIVTTVDHVDSSPLCISSGVPQGSVLGPILFIIYMADLPVAVKQNTCALFADDTLVYSTSCTPSQHPCCNLQEDIDAVQTWSSDWNATFNSAKSQQMVVGRHGCATGGNLVLGGDKLQQVCTVSHLGLTLASTLKWSDHVSGILKRAAPKAAALKTLGYRARVSVDTMSLLYKTILRPRLEYASIAWGNCSATDSRRLERLQLSVARVVMHQRRHPSMSKSQLKQLGWPTLAWRRRRAKLIYFWKLVNNQGPPCLSSRIPKSVNNRCEYSLRNTGTVELPACSSSLYLSSFIPSSCLLWNSLPPEVSSSSSVSSFTLMLDSHFSSDRFTLGLS